VAPVLGGMMHTKSGGWILVFTMFVVILLGIILLWTIRIFGQYQQIIKNQQEQLQNFYLTESGIQFMIAKVKNEPHWVDSLILNKKINKVFELPNHPDLQKINYLYMTKGQDNTGEFLQIESNINYQSQDLISKKIKMKKDLTIVVTISLKKLDDHYLIKIIDFQKL
jgi:hypothetical protein